MTSSPLDIFIELLLKGMTPAALEWNLLHPAYGFTGCERVACVVGWLRR